jgi:hypothetical protein
MKINEIAGGGKAADQVRGNEPTPKKSRPGGNETPHPMRGRLVGEDIVNEGFGILTKFFASNPKWVRKLANAIRRGESEADRIRSIERWATRSDLPSEVADEIFELLNLYRTGNPKIKYTVSKILFQNSNGTIRLGRYSDQGLNARAALKVSEAASPGATGSASISGAPKSMNRKTTIRRGVAPNALDGDVLLASEYGKPKKNSKKR